MILLRLEDDRRLATLPATARYLEAKSAGGALELLDFWTLPAAISGPRAVQCSIRDQERP